MDVPLPHPRAPREGDDGALQGGAGRRGGGAAAGGERASPPPLGRRITGAATRFPQADVAASGTTPRCKPSSYEFLRVEGTSLPAFVRPRADEARGTLAHGSS